MWFYFFNIFGLSFVIAPEYNREFGVIENTQLLIIGSMFLVSFKSYRISKMKLDKIIFLVIVLVSIFMFLEEMDYGVHIYDYLSGMSHADLVIKYYNEPITNVHNQGKLTHYFKLSTYVGFVLLLVIIPAIKSRVQLSNRYLGFIVSSKYFIYSLIAMALLNRLALYMDKTVEHSSITSLNSNVSEFEEVFIYYIMLVYLLELKRKKAGCKSISCDRK